MFRIEKQFTFSASHQLSHLEPSHQCARLHGHNYRVILVLASEDLDSRGFIYDYGDLHMFNHYINTKLDHRHLNEVFGNSEMTTAEHLAKHLYEVAKRSYGDMVAMVRVSETDRTWAEYYE